MSDMSASKKIKGKGSQSGTQLPKSSGNKLSKEAGDIKKKDGSQYSKDMMKEAGYSKPNA